MRVLTIEDGADDAGKGVLPLGLELHTRNQLKHQTCKHTLPLIQKKIGGDEKVSNKLNTANILTCDDDIKVQNRKKKREEKNNVQEERKNEIDCSLLSASRRKACLLLSLACLNAFCLPKSPNQPA